MASAGRLQYDLGLNTTGFSSSLRKAALGLTSFYASFKLGQMAGRGFRRGLDLGSELKHLSDETGETAGNLLVLRQAFDDCGISTQQLPMAIGFMRRALSGVSETGERTEKIFEMLGLRMEELRGKSAMEQFEAIGIALGQLGNMEDRVAMAQQIFGRSGMALNRLFANPAAIREAAAALGSMPGMMDNLSAGAERLQTNFGRIKTQLDGFWLGAGAGLLPAIEKLSGWIASQDLVKAGAEFGATITVAMEEISGGRWKELATEAADYLGDKLEEAVERGTSKLGGSALRNMFTWPVGWLSWAGGHQTAAYNAAFGGGEYNRQSLIKTTKVWNEAVDSWFIDPSFSPPQDADFMGPPDLRDFQRRKADRAESLLRPAATKPNPPPPPAQEDPHRSMYDGIDTGDGHQDLDLLAALKQAQSWTVPGGADAFSGDQWARIGAFAGGSTDRVTGLMQQATRTLGTIAKAAESIKARVDNLQPVTL